MNSIADFADALSSESLTQVETAIAILWFHDHEAPDAEILTRSLALQVSELGLSKAVNMSRLSDAIRKHKATTAGKSKNSVRLTRAARHSLDSKYGQLLAFKRLRADDSLLPAALFEGARPYHKAIARQANVAYTYNLYDACAVLCRRLAESLLIDVFVAVGAEAAIKTPAGDYLMLGPIISQAKSGKYFKLGRGNADGLDKVKEVGDRAAHSRSYLTLKSDVDSMQTQLRAALSDLVQLAGLNASKKSVAQ